MPNIQEARPTPASLHATATEPTVLPVDNYTLKDRTRVATFRGTCLGDVTSRREGSPRWTDLAIYNAMPVEPNRPSVFVLSKRGGSRVVHSDDCRFARSRSLPLGASMTYAELMPLADALRRGRFLRSQAIDRARRSDTMCADPNPHHSGHFGCYLDFSASGNMNPLTLRFERPLETFTLFDSADALVESLHKYDAMSGKSTLPWLANKLLIAASAHDDNIAAAYKTLV